MPFSIWEKDNVFIANSQNGTLTNGYYRTSQSVQAESTDGNAPNELNMIARWWCPEITNTEIVGVTTNPKSEETVTITDPNSPAIQHQIILLLKRVRRQVPAPKYYLRVLRRIHNHNLLPYEIAHSHNCNNNLRGDASYPCPSLLLLTMLL